MGQIFNACAYDIDAKTCCVYDADKFHANCYSFSGTVYSMHYLLRQKAYRIMWGGYEVFIFDHLKKFSRTEDLLGFSTYCDKLNLTPEDYHRNSEESEEKIKFIAENSSRWEKMHVWDKAVAMFKNKGNLYRGFLLNHTQKMAVDLSDYYKQSFYTNEKGNEMAIDPIPVLTETGEGAQMLFFDGVAAESTEELAGTWCGDLLQIVDELPDGFQVINCCFAELLSMAKHYYRTFGVNKDDLIIANNDGKLYEIARLGFDYKRGPVLYLKITVEQDSIRISSVRKK